MGLSSGLTEEGPFAFPSHATNTAGSGDTWKYPGTLPGLIVEWSDFGGPGGNRFTLEYCRSSAIRNYTVSAGILEFTMGMDWLYPVGKFSLFSRGASTTFVCPVSPDFLADASLATNVVALGGRLVNPDDTQASMFEFLTLVSGLRCKADIGFRYLLYSNLSVRLGYRLEVVRIDAWDYFVSGSDMAVLSVRYGF